MRPWTECNLPKIVSAQPRIWQKWSSARDWSKQKQCKSCSVKNQLAFVQSFEMHYSYAMERPFQFIFQKQLRRRLEFDWEIFLISSNSHSNDPIERSLSYAKSRNGPKIDVLSDTTVNTERILDKPIISTTTRSRQSHLVSTISQRLAVLEWMKIEVSKTKWKKESQQKAIKNISTFVLRKF